MDENQFQEIEQQLSELGRQHFYKKTKHNKNIKEQFYLAYLAQNLQEPFCSLLQFSTTSKEKGILIHLISCTASEMWKEAPERSTKNQSA